MNGFIFMQGKWFTDSRLAVGILIVQLPVIATVVVMAAFFHIRLETAILQNEVRESIKARCMHV